MSKLEADKESLKTKLKMAIQKGKSIESDKKRYEGLIYIVALTIRCFGHSLKKRVNMKQGDAKTPFVLYRSFALDQ